MFKYDKSNWIIIYVNILEVDAHSTKKTQKSNADQDFDELTIITPIAAHIILSQ